MVRPQLWNWSPSVDLEQRSRDSGWLSKVLHSWTQHSCRNLKPQMCRNVLCEDKSCSTLTVKVHWITDDPLILSDSKFLENWAFKWPVERLTWTQYDVPVTVPKQKRLLFCLWFCFLYRFECQTCSATKKKKADLNAPHSGLYRAFTATHNDFRITS